MKCINCGSENLETAKFCKACGTVIRTTQTESYPSGAWYLVAIFFGILGGIIGYFAIRDKNKGMAKKQLIVGFVSTILLTIFWIIILWGPTTGSISVSSAPSGASIYLDSAYKGMTPMMIDSIEPGSHTIELELGGYQVWSQTVYVDAGKTSDVYPSLQLKTPSAIIRKVWVDHNVYENNLKGMKIHVMFDINNLKDESCQAWAFFYFKDGTALPGYNKKYSSVDNKLAMGEDFIPIYESSTFNDFTLFMPYDEIDLSGSYDLKFHVVLFHGNTQLDTSDWVYFTYTS